MMITTNVIFTCSFYVFLIVLNVPAYTFAENYFNDEGEECLLNNQRRGVCRIPSNCPATGTRRYQENGNCRAQGNICCELNHEGTGSHNQPSEVNKFSEENFSLPRSTNSTREDIKSYSEEISDKFYSGGQHAHDNRNRWHGRGNVEIHFSYSDTNNYNTEEAGRRVEGSNNPYFGGRREEWWVGDVISDIVEQNTGFQNWNGEPQFSQWSSHNQQYSRPTSENNRYEYNFWSNDEKYPSNYNRDTTHHPSLSTWRPTPIPNYPSHTFTIYVGQGDSKWQELHPSNNRPTTDYPRVSPQRPAPAPSYSSNGPVIFGPHGNKWEEKYPSNHNRQTTEYPRPNKYNQAPNYHEQRPNFNQQQNSYHSGNRKRISEIKCEEYSKPVTETITGIPLILDPEPITVNVPKCTLAQQLIVGGQNTSIAEFPHMAALGYYDKGGNIAWKCGGTLISDQYVVTAAHCIKPKLVKVRLGEYNLNSDNDGVDPEDYSITEIIKHPEYKIPKKYNDIALLKLSRKVKIKKHIRPACLHTKKEVSEENVIAIGWGVKEEYDTKFNEVLQKVVLSLVNHNVCNRSYSNIKKEQLPNGIIDSQVCAGEYSGGKDTCQGDSGGPIEYIGQSNQCVHYIVGITSFGKSCGRQNSPGVYTRVSSYVPWIERIVWPRE